MPIFILLVIALVVVYKKLRETDRRGAEKEQFFQSFESEESDSFSFSEDPDLEEGQFSSSSDEDDGEEGPSVAVTCKNCAASVKVRLGEATKCPFCNSYVSADEEAVISGLVGYLLSSDEKEEKELVASNDEEAEALTALGVISGQFRSFDDRMNDLINVVEDFSRAIDRGEDLVPTMKGLLEALNYFNYETRTFSHCCSDYLMDIELAVPYMRKDFCLSIEKEVDALFDFSKSLISTRSAITSFKNTVENLFPATASFKFARAKGELLRAIDTTALTVTESANRIKGALDDFKKEVHSCFK